MTSEQGTATLKAVKPMPRWRKQAIAVVTDIAALPLALWSAFALRLGEWSPEVIHFWPAFVASALVCVPVFGGLGLYRHVVRHMGTQALLVALERLNDIAGRDEYHHEKMSPALAPRRDGEHD